MDQKQKFTLLVIGGLIILGMVIYYVLQETRLLIKEKAKQEVIAQGFQGAKEVFDQLRRRP